jgi:hypothetical protein
LPYKFSCLGLKYFLSFISIAKQIIFDIQILNIMKRLITVLFVLGFSVATLAQNNRVFHHSLNVKIDPKTSLLEVEDVITVETLADFIFSLNADLAPVTFSKNVKVTKVDQHIPAGDIGMDRDESSGSLKINQYKVHLKGKKKTFTVSYSGKIASAIEQSEENYQRGFSESPGIIGEMGVYLAGSTYWVPTVENGLITFNLTTTLPKGWKTVSQGKRELESVKDDNHLDTWFCESPQEEVFLIAAEFTEYGYEMNSGIMAMAFLRTPDEALANKYLEVTEQYMEMYQGLVADYPYSKFALVENFWETGYGMPSFTLLGEKIIRFPFILHSSYPHELLHNWWGNGVYVDFKQGNWCEGITAYMADHLIKEQRGQGENYRRSTVQKFTNFVNPDNDFPLSKFASRYDGPSEAIGYGKSLMMWHMLRRKLGDETFTKGWQRFYELHKFKVASFNDIRLAMEAVSGVNLEPFFNQWVLRTGAPELMISSLSTDTYNNQYRIFLTLEQTQPEDAFLIDVPIAVATEKGVQNFTVQMSKKSQDFQLVLNEKPLKLAVDPQYDVFRILDPKEVPPALSKIWASKENLVILPTSADEVHFQLYTEFANQWKEADAKDHFEIVKDNEVSELPTDKTVWIIGYENKFATTFNKSMEVYQSAIKTDSVIFGKKELAKGQNSFVVTVFNPADATQSMVFIQPGKVEAIPGLIRKLPHYGKYSYLAFEGDEPVNIAKGQWMVINSPLVKVLDADALSISVINERKALAYVKPLFSEKRMMETIKYLASDELMGRGLGTPYLDTAAQYIANKFKAYGLQPLGETYFQTFKHKFPNKPGPQDLTLKNVIAVIPGSDPTLSKEPVVVSAHYDHLGLGWPDVHAGDEGKIHHGADDNASGVSILLELAKNLSKLKPKRTIIFAVFSGEEAGLIGSRYFVAHCKGKVFANVNLDTDGSLFDTKLLVLNANTAREWKFIFMGTDYTTGVKSEVIQQPLDASDQVAFIEQGIPAVQLFTGPTQNYHRPTDTWDRIDGKGLVKVATVTKEVVEYLADREDAMPFTGTAHAGKGKSAQKQSTKTAQNKRVSTGSVPDFTFAGEGVKIGAVIEGSAGAKAGLQKDDIIVAVNNDKVTDLRNYTAILKKYQPGDKVKMKVMRDGKEKTIDLILGER